MPQRTLEYFCDTNRHLVCKPYSTMNLHMMAGRLGIKPCWFHKDHYDIPVRRIPEITRECTVVDSKTILRIIRGEE